LGQEEVVAGLTTFVTMSYIVVVNPAVLKAAGVARGFLESATGVEAGGRTGLTAVVTATCFRGTLFFSQWSH
jgi:adenine/guanine/hypoxanthine permease